MARATEILDSDTELELDFKYLLWAEAEFDSAEDEEVKQFFGGLQDVLHHDWWDQRIGARCRHWDIRVPQLDGRKTWMSSGQ